MTPIALVHTALGVVSLATGAVVLARRKGDRAHRLAGRVYVGAMVALCALAFGLRGSTPGWGGLGPFHVAAVVSLGTVSAGAVVAWRRRGQWFEGHFMWMAWSYIGLVMATGGHVVQPLSVALRDAGLARSAAAAVALGVAWALPPLVGARWIAARRPAWRALGARTGAAEATGTA